MQDEVRTVGAEDPRGVAFRLADRAGVLEQGAELLHRDREVAAQQPLPEVVVKGPAHGRLQKGDTAGVRRGMPRVLVRVVEAPQRLEERREQGVLVSTRGGGDPPRNERRRVLQRPHITHHRLRHPQRQLMQPLVRHDQEHRQILEPASDSAQNHRATRPVLSSGQKIPGHHRSSQTGLRPEHRLSVRDAHHPPDLQARRPDPVGDARQLPSRGASSLRMLCHCHQNRALGHAAPLPGGTRHLLPVFAASVRMIVQWPVKRPQRVAARTAL